MLSIAVNARRSLRLLSPLFFLCVAFGTPALAEYYIKPTVRPAPDTVKVPVLQAAVDPGGIRDYEKFFVFWKNDTSYAAAFADLDECRIYGLQTKVVAITPIYAPMGVGEINKPGQPAAYSYGIVGGALVGYLIGQAQKAEYSQTEKRCMAYKGYSRFGISRANWTEIMAGEQAEVVARRALIAAGPQPTWERVDP